MSDLKTLAQRDAGLSHYWCECGHIGATSTTSGKALLADGYLLCVYCYRPVVQLDLPSDEPCGYGRVQAYSGNDLAGHPTVHGDKGTKLC